jgi:hypothetical protein
MLPPSSGSNCLTLKKQEVAYYSEPSVHSITRYGMESKETRISDAIITFRIDMDVRQLQKLTCVTAVTEPGDKSPFFNCTTQYAKHLFP